MSSDFKVVAVAYCESGSLTVGVGNSPDCHLAWSSKHLPVLDDHLLLDYTVRTYTNRSVMCKYLHIGMDESAYPNGMKSLEHICASYAVFGGLPLPTVTSPLYTTPLKETADPSILT